MANCSVRSIGGDWRQPSVHLPHFRMEETAGPRIKLYFLAYHFLAGSHPSFPEYRAKSSNQSASECHPRGSQLRHLPEPHTLRVSGQMFRPSPITHPSPPQIFVFFCHQKPFTLTQEEERGTHLLVCVPLFYLRSVGVIVVVGDCPLPFFLLHLSIARPSVPFFPTTTTILDQMDRTTDYAGLTRFSAMGEYYWVPSRQYYE